MATAAKSHLVEWSTLSGFRVGDWETWVAHCQKRQKPASLERVCNGARPLLWGLPNSILAENKKTLRRLADLHAGMNAVSKKDAEFLQQLPDAFGTKEPSLSALVLANGVAGAMPALTEVVTEEAWCQALNTIYQIALDVLGNPDRLLGQLANEILITIAYQFPELNHSQDIWETSLEYWTTSLQEMLDSDGAVQAAYCKLLPLLLATWTRVHQLSPVSALGEEIELTQIWEWFLRYNLRLLRRDGTSMLAEPGIPYCLELYQAAVSTSTDKQDRVIARQVLPGGNPKRKKPKDISEEGVFSEWAGLGVLQQDWSARSPRLAVAVQGESMQIEICRGIELLKLEGFPDVSINGKRLQPSGSWEEVATHFDEDIDYLELEMLFSDQVRVQRQILLLQDDEVIMVADSVFAESKERIDYQNQLQLGPAVSCLQETENNEIYLQQKKICALLLPLGLSEWKSQRFDNCFLAAQGSVKLCQSNYGKTLYAPLMINVNPKESIKPRTWRSLTVAEKLEIVEHDTARSYRVRIGNRQWIIYKSFAAPGNRTFFGQNKNGDFFIGRMEEDGNVEELLSLEL